MSTVAGARKLFALTDLEIEFLQHVALLSGAGLLLSLVVLIYGADLGAGFF